MLQSPHEHRLFLQSQGFSCLGASATLGLEGLFFSVRWVKNAVLVTAMNSFSLSAILKIHFKNFNLRASRKVKLDSIKSNLGKCLS